MSGSEPPLVQNYTASHSRKTDDKLEEQRQIIVESVTESSDSDGDKEKTPRYVKLIVKHPYVLLVTFSVLVVLCACFSFIPQLGAKPLPDFKEPFKGFEARGTVISDRWRSQLNLFYSEQKGEVSRVPKKCGIKNPISEQDIGDAPAICSKEQTFNPGKLTVKLAFREKNGGNLFTAKNLKSICRLEHNAVRTYYNFDDHCHKAKGTHHCCPTWSVGYYVALLSGESSCLSIDDDQVKEAGSLIKMCSKHYHNGALQTDCWDFTSNSKKSEKCANVPANCTKFNAVHNIMHFLSDKHFLSDNSSLFLRYSLAFVPVKENADFQVGIYKSKLKDKDLTDGNVELSGYEMSKLKYEMFNQRIIEYLYLPAIAMFLVMIILWVYTHSLFITCLIGMIVVSSLVFAYFICSVLFSLDFFPCLNILTFVFLVGIAADNAFVYIDIWSEFTQKITHKRSAVPPLDKDEQDAELIQITLHTMKHASLSMFVTSFTTASAFFAGLTSEIISIRLFGLYSGLSILSMFALMITWFPAAVIIEQTVFSKRSCCTEFCAKIYGIFFGSGCTTKNVVKKLLFWHRTFFHEILPQIVIKLRYFWIVFFFLLAVGGMIVSTVEPGLQLPTSQVFQMFHESHVLEKYPLELSDLFHFESTKRFSFPINLIWGTKAIDKGDQFNPFDQGPITWNNDFDIASKKSQKWILSFITRLKKQPFVKSGKKSFIEEFFAHLRNTNCTDKNEVCCKDSKFPYAPSNFTECLLQFQCLKFKDNEFISQSIADSAPLFDVEDKLKAMTLNFESSVSFTSSYGPADKFWKQSSSWVDGELSDTSLATKGWFVSRMEFYDLQKSLSKGTLLSMSISLGIAFGVMLLTTGNFYTSLFAIITITCALGVTVGTLVLMGWKLNILESIVLSVSVGLSVDFALHYGVAYVLAADKTERKSRVFFSITGMSSAVSMAALTTFITGAISTQSTVIAYIQLGHFLMIIMSISWLYSTFFFQALCCVWGPENESGQITLTKLKAAYTKLKSCWRCENESSDRYQFITKEDGAVVKVPVRVVYIK